MRNFRIGLALAASILAVSSFGPVAKAKNVSFEVREGTNFAVAASRDGRKLALDLQGRIWVLAAAGGKATPITPVMNEARHPVWSPDGQWIAFQYYNDSNWHIAVSHPDGSGFRQITSGYFDDREPSWRPDGKGIVFSSDRTHSLDLWQVNLDDGSLAPITSTAEDDFYPAVSPDGKRIALVRAEDRTTRLIIEEGGAVRTLPTGTSEISRINWSPDGSRISAILFDRSRGDARIEVFDAATGKVVASHSRAGEDLFPTGASWLDKERLVFAADGEIRIWNLASGTIGKRAFAANFTVEQKPKYKQREIDLTSTGDRPVLGILRPMASPDGRQIAFTAMGNIWLLTVGNPDPVQITNDKFLHVDPTWSRDGGSLAYVSDKRGAGVMDLFVRDMASGAERRLTTTEQDILQPAFSPDGKTIAVFMRNSADWHGATLYLVDVATGTMKKAHDALFLPSVPSWSADGSKITVLSLQVYSDRFRKGDNAFFTIDLASGKGDFTSPEANKSISSRTQFGPIWSPDGTRLAYISDGLLWSAEANAAAKLTKLPLQLSSDYASYPSWSGDSGSITYLTGHSFQRVNLVDGKTQTIPMNLTWRRPANPRTLVVQAGRLFTGVSERYLRNVDIVVEDNVIRQIVPHRSNWAGATVIDARTKTVVPGLFETHIHQFPSDGTKTDKSWLAFGVTSVREPGAEPYEALERREAWMSGQRIGPREFYANLLEGRRVFYWLSSTVVNQSTLERELKRAIDLDYDFIKTYETMDFDRQKQVIDFAHAHGLPVASHELYPAVTYGADAVEHLGTADRMEFSDRISLNRKSYDDVIQLMAHSGIYINPTAARPPSLGHIVEFDAHPGIADLPQMRDIEPRYKRALNGMITYMHKQYGDSTDRLEANEIDTLARIGRTGVRIGAGTDGSPWQGGYSVILETAHLARALGSYKALRTATIDAAQITGVDRYLGSVEVGKIADMVIVEGDPLKDVTDLFKIETVIKDGRAYPLAELIDHFDMREDAAKSTGAQ